jgi:hypothetical protein
MPNEPRPIQGAITLQLIPLDAGGFAVALLLRHDCIVELYDGPWPGAILLPAEARRLADLLRIAAEDVEARGGRQDG